MRIMAGKLKILALLLGAATISISTAGAETLPLTPGLVSLNSEEGEALLIGAEAKKDYFPLSIHFTTQVNPAYCGPASIAMILNALDLPRPPSKMTLGLGMFDQENIFTPETDMIKTSAQIMKGGMTLDELAGVLKAHALTVDIHHAADSSLDEFRKIAMAELAEDQHFVVVNYLRKAIGQEAGGHISPVGAYDADTDRFLILDVSRYKYPPIWVQAEALYGAMNTPDSDNDNKSRGYLVISKK